MSALALSHVLFFFNDTATTEIYTLSLHDALPISPCCLRGLRLPRDLRPGSALLLDRKSTRLNSSHGYISYAVFCLKNKQKNTLNGRHVLLRCPARYLHRVCRAL